MLTTKHFKYEKMKSLPPLHAPPQVGNSVPGVPVSHPRRYGPVVYWRDSAALSGLHTPLTALPCSKGRSELSQGCHKSI